MDSLFSAEECSMSDPQLWLQYQPTKQDLIAGRPNATGFRGLGPFLAVMPPSSYLVHGNSEVLLLDQNKRNVALQYDTLRYMRTWTLASGTGFTPTGPIYNWNLDTQGNGPSWIDIPGAKLFADPAEWPEEREMLEFFVMVDGYPEVGSLYFFVVVSLKPGQYRVEMSSALLGKTGDASPPGNTPQPWATESRCAIPIDSGWLRVPTLPQSLRKK
jgi:hypothetical protein